MSDRSDYFYHILSSIGAPLMGAILSKGKANADAATDMAGLLGTAVQSSIDLGPLVELENKGEQADNVRVALAGLSSQIIATHYAEKGAQPSADDLKRVQDGLKAVIAFAENFTANAENAARLATLKADGVPAIDTAQSHVQYMVSFIPVIGAVQDFAFGKPPEELLKNIAERISKTAQDIAGRIGGDEALARGVLGTLAQLYAQAHTHHVAQFGKDVDAPDQALEALWQTFDAQVDMLEALVAAIVPGMTSAAPAPLAQAEPVSVPEPVKEEAPPAPPAPFEDKPAEEKPAAPSADGGNPMAFFGSKKPEDEKPKEEPPAAPSPPPAQRLRLRRPKEDTPPPAAEEPQKEEPAKADNPAAPPAGGNPMAFFKKSDDDDDE